MKSSRKLLLTGTVGALIPLALYASDQVNGMYNFVDGDPILTEEVNENFQHLAGLINSTDNVAHISVDDVTGNVGIGTKMSNFKFEVNGTISSTLTSGEIFRNSSTTTNGGYFHLGTNAMDAYWGSASSAGANPLSGTALLNYSLFFGSKDGTPVQFVTTGAPRMTIDGSGNVGIGTATPTTRLHLAAGNVPTLTIQQTDSTNTLRILSGNERASLGVGKSGELLVLQHFTGNVGIGTTAPSAALDVVRSGTNDPIALFGSTGPTDEQALTVQNGSGGISLFAQGGNGTFLTGATQGDVGIRFRAGDDFFIGQEREPLLTIKSGGNVGIGTTSPGERLTVNGNLAFAGGSGTIFSESPITSGGQDLTLDATGSVVVKIDSNGNSTNDDYFAIGHNGIGDNLLVVKALGNVGIGTTSPSQRLHVIGNVSADDYLYNSDLRLKTDILPLENASEGIACLEGVTYRWNDPASSQDLQIGLIAQDVERCFPEVVTTDPKGYKSVSYARLVAPLIENAKEQQSLNTSQQLEIARLKAAQSTTQAALAATNARLAKLEALLNSRR